MWDGGASGAAVRSAHFEAERARLQLAQARQDARAEIDRLLDQLEVSGRRLEILSKQEELAAQKVRVAEERFADERINKVAMLEAEVARARSAGPGPRGAEDLSREPDRPGEPVRGVADAGCR